MTSSIIQLAFFATSLIFVKDFYFAKAAQQLTDIDSDSTPSNFEELEKNIFNEISNSRSEDLNKDFEHSSTFTQLKNNQKKSNNEESQSYPRSNTKEPLEDKFFKTLRNTDIKNWENSLSHNSNLITQKKNSKFFDTPNHGLNEYLLYDWGPNPTIWGSVRQGIKEKNKMATPEKNEYFNPAYMQYGWHSNQNFWGKRGFPLNRNNQKNKRPNDLTQDERRLDYRNYYFYILEKILSDLKCLKSKECYKEVNIQQLRKKSRPMNVKYSDIFWASRGRRAEGNDSFTSIYKNGTAIPTLIFAPNLDSKENIEMPVLIYKSLLSNKDGNTDTPSWNLQQINDNDEEKINIPTWLFLKSNLDNNEENTETPSWTFQPAMGNEFEKINLPMFNLNKNTKRILSSEELKPYKKYIIKSLLKNVMTNMPTSESSKQMAMLSSLKSRGKKGLDQKSLNRLFRQVGAISGTFIAPRG